jgi:hypothetical protein
MFFKVPGDDVRLKLLTFTGKGGADVSKKVALDASTPGVEIKGATGNSIVATLSGTNKTKLASIFDLNGTNAKDSTAYNLAAAEGWVAYFVGESLTDFAVTVSGVPKPVRRHDLGLEVRQLRKHS